MNNASTTLLDALIPSPVQYPIYHVAAPSFFSFVSDKNLSLWGPVVAYWALSLFFQLLDWDLFKWAEKYRIHESAEVKARNLAQPAEVVRMVFVQHAIQVGLGMVAVEDDPHTAFRNHAGEMRDVAKWLARAVIALLGEERGEKVLVEHGRQAVSCMYWWGIPIFQFLLAIVVMDTWQYFLHRLFHVNKYLYRKFHSVHHRLYVPYAYGALYNHPFEGLLFDSLGAVVAETVACMAPRQSALLFIVSTLKTVDDHCGYSLPWDPLQMCFGNNAAYHDIHHQSVGLKSNFSQPYFIHWDTLLGTRMTRAEMEAKQKRNRKAVE